MIRTGGPFSLNGYSFRLVDTFFIVLFVSSSPICQKACDRAEKERAWRDDTLSRRLNKIQIYTSNTSRGKKGAVMKVITPGWQKGSDEREKKIEAKKLKAALGKKESSKYAESRKQIIPKVQGLTAPWNSSSIKHNGVWGCRDVPGAPRWEQCTRLSISKMVQSRFKHIRFRS